MMEGKFNFTFDAESTLAFVATINGAERKFGKLSMRDFADLHAMMPDAQRAKAGFSETFDWMRSPAGIIATVAVSGQKFDPVFTQAEAGAWPVDVLFDLAAEVRRISGGTLIEQAESSADPNAATTDTGGMQDIRG